MLAYLSHLVLDAPGGLDYYPCYPGPTPFAYLYGIGVVLNPRSRRSFSYSSCFYFLEHIYSNTCYL